MMNDQVYCRSDYQYAQRPLAFDWLGQRLAVTEIMGSWQTPDTIQFTVSTELGIFNLVYHQSNDQWSIHQP
jgi:hypothetical protein